MERFPLSDEAAWAIITRPLVRPLYEHQRTFRRRASRRERWISNVDRTPGGCWLWTGPITTPSTPGKQSYPAMIVNSRNNAGASRSAFWWMAYEWFPDLFPSPRKTATTCGAFLCVSPLHREVGVNVSRGNKRLTVDQVQAIYRAKGEQSCYRLAEQFGVTAAAVSDIWTGRNWSKVTGQPNPRKSGVVS